MLEQKLEDANRKLQAARDVAESASGLAKEQAEKQVRELRAEVENLLRDQKDAAEKAKKASDR